MLWALSVDPLVPVTPLPARSRATAVTAWACAALPVMAFLRLAIGPGLLGFPFERALLPAWWKAPATADMAEDQSTRPRPCLTRVAGVDAGSAPMVGALVALAPALVETTG